MNIYIDRLKQMTLTAFEKENVSIFLFGSRAKGTARPGSDVDIGILPSSENFNPAKISIFREKIENSSIPYKVDLVNLLDVSNDFRKKALTGALIWKSCS